MKGTITALDHRHFRGVILGQDRKQYPFDRDTMFTSMQFEGLALGMEVWFDVDVSDCAIHVGPPLLRRAAC